MGPTSHTYISQRLKLHYVDWGNKDAPPLLLVHGGRDHCRNWDWVAKELCKDWHIIAPDLRGHGNSEWVSDGHYTTPSYVYDIAQLVHQMDLAPLTIIGHSLGGNISLRFTGLYPEKVKKLVAIEGLGLSPKMMEEMAARPMDDRWRSWIEDKRQSASRQPKKYDSIDAALERMKAENQHLSDEQARHLTIHGINQNEDGSWSWKFDNYLRVWPPFDMTYEQMQNLWSRVTCPTLLCYGEKSWASNPLDDGRIEFFQNAEVKTYADAGHWLHHDKTEEFLADVKSFLSA